MKIKTLVLYISLINSFSYAVAQDIASTQLAKSTKTDENEVIQLQEIKVEGDKAVGTILNQNYTVDSSSSATKLDIRLKDTPQSVTTITEQQIQDQDLKDLRDIVEATPGLTAVYQNSQADAAKFYSRGFQIDNFQVDGIIANQDSIGFNPDPFIYERIEVVRGSTGLTTGMGDPAGSINFTRKKPLLENAGQFNVKYGSWKNFRQELDYSRLLNKSGSLRGRVLAINQTGKYFIDRASKRYHLFYGVLQYDLADKHEFTFGVNYSFQRKKQFPWEVNTYMQSDEVIEDFPRSFNNTTRWTWEDETILNTFLGYKYSLSDRWSLNAIVDYKKDRSKGIFGNLTHLDQYKSRGNYYYNYGISNYLHKGWSGDINLTGKWDWNGLEQQLIVGVNGFKYDYGGIKHGATNGGTRDGFSEMVGYIPLERWNDGDIPIMNPHYLEGGKLRGPVLGAFGDYGHYKKTQYGLYFVTQLRPLNKLTVLLGGRYNYWSDPTIVDVETLNKVTDFTPYLGATFEVTPNINGYLSYAGIFKSPTTDQWGNKDENGNFNPAITGNSKEIGIKGELNDGALNFAISYFNMTQKNLPLGGGNLGSGRAGDGFNNFGLDFNLAGKITPNWKINAGYTRLNAKIPKDYSVYGNGKSARHIQDAFFAPKHMFKLFSSYQYKKLELGMGVRWQSIAVSTYSLAFNGPALKDDENAIKQRPYAVVDLMLRYKFNKNISLGFNLSNLFDKRYLVNVKAYELGFGPPRSFNLNLSTKF